MITILVIFATILTMVCYYSVFMNGKVTPLAMMCAAAILLSFFAAWQIDIRQTNIEVRRVQEEFDLQVVSREEWPERFFVKTEDEEILECTITVDRDLIVCDGEVFSTRD